MISIIRNPKFENTSMGYKCPGHCYGLSTCPHAELVYGGNGELVAVRCKLPKLIAPNTWLVEAGYRTEANQLTFKERK